MYEHKFIAPISSRRFIIRIILHATISICILVMSLLLGISGYEHFENLSWIDAFVNSAMLLGGMGPVNLPITDNGKIFAALYALYSGLVFLIAFGIVMTPVIHRIAHTIHWDQK